MNVSIAIMAAGFGTMMKSSLPKVLHPMSGHPMLYHIIHEAKKISDDIHVIVYHQHETIISAMQMYFDDVTYVLQDHENVPGTGGAMMAVNPKHDKVLVLNGDMPLVTAKTLEPLLAIVAPVVLTAFKTSRPFGYGRIKMDNALHVTDIVEEKDATEEEKTIDIVNAGVYLFERDFLSYALPLLSNANAQREYYLTDLIGIATQKACAIKAVMVDEEAFMGVNSKVHLAKAETLMQTRIKTYWMEQGVSMRLPETSFIDALATFEGECILENGVSILGKTVLKNSTIKAQSVIEESTIDSSNIGPLARIRPKCYIAHSHIGNFVEVKNSTLQGVKAGHLSYLGDASIDEGTNVGCGTITCNYDGKAKHKTCIGKNVFIGSDTQLIAPVTIEDDVLIGAGSTITSNVPSGALAISRTKMQIKLGFFKRFFSSKRDHETA
jgi:bifunctional UDP-N-acetylglucosamine pyrophosphorylase/glucosamine-1-phosphate N-acetyltransferase